MRSIGGGRQGRKLILLAVIITINIGADQITKFAAKENLQGKGTVRVVGNLLILRYAENEGAFLSMGSRLPEKVKTALLVILPGIIILGGILYLIKWIDRISPLQIIALGSLIGGGTSNLYDRIAQGGRVVDFLNMGIGGVRTGIFNIADLSILAGGVLLIICFFRE